MTKQSKIKILTKGEKTFLRKYFPIKSIKHLAECLDVKPHTVYRLAKLLNIKKKRENRVWTKERIAILKQKYSESSFEELIKKLGVSKNAIIHAVARFKIPLKRQKWTKTQINILIKEYNSKGPTALQSKLNKSYASIQNKAIRLKLTKNKGIIWTARKKQILLENYPSGNKRKLAKRLGIKYHTLLAAASRFNIKSINKNTGRLKLLYQNTLLAYYWIGFIMGDGHFQNNLSAIEIGLGIKDKKHLEKFLKLTGGKIKIRKQKHTYKGKTTFYQICKLYVSDPLYVRKITKKFNLTPGLPKTYNPPSHLDFPSNKHFLAFLIGFIDADGCMATEKSGLIKSIVIACHSSWRNIFLTFQNRLKFLNIFSSVYLKGDYITILICRYKQLRFLKQFVITHNLPVLERKWDKIDLNRKITSKMIPYKFDKKLLLP